MSVPPTVLLYAAQGMAYSRGNYSQKYDYNDIVAGESTLVACNDEGGNFGQYLHSDKSENDEVEFLTKNSPMLEGMADGMYGGNFWDWLFDKLGILPDEYVEEKYGGEYSEYFKVGQLAGNSIPVLYGGSELAISLLPSANQVIETAKQSQELIGYNVDEFTTTTLKAGDKIYGLTPGQGQWYTTMEMVKKSGYSYTNLYNGLQIKPHPTLGYRTSVTLYEVTQDVVVATGQALNNTSVGSGGYTQFFIENFDDVLKAIQEIPLGR